MNPGPHIDLHIDALVVHGMAEADRSALLDALVGQLQAQLGLLAADHAWSARGAVGPDAISVDVAQQHGPRAFGAGAGVAVARAVDRVLTGD